MKLSLIAKLWDQASTYFRQAHGASSEKAQRHLEAKALKCLEEARKVQYGEA